MLILSSSIQAPLISFPPPSFHYVCLSNVDSPLMGRLIVVSEPCIRPLSLSGRGLYHFNPASFFEPRYEQMAGAWSWGLESRKLGYNPRLSKHTGPGVRNLCISQHIIRLISRFHNTGEAWCDLAGISNPWHTWLWVLLKKSHAFQNSSIRGLEL